MISLWQSSRYIGLQCMALFIVTWRSLSEINWDDCIRTSQLPNDEKMKSSWCSGTASQFPGWSIFNDYQLRSLNKSLRLRSWWMDCNSKQNSYPYIRKVDNWYEVSSLDTLSLSRFITNQLAAWCASWYSWWATRLHRRSAECRAAENSVRRCRRGTVKQGARHNQ